MIDTVTRLIEEGHYRSEVARRLGMTYGEFRRLLRKDDGLRKAVNEAEVKAWVRNIEALKKLGILYAYDSRWNQVLNRDEGEDVEPIIITEQQQ